MPGVPWPLHFANRITSGAKKNFIDAIKDFGFQAILGWQLDPEAIDDGGFEELLYENLPTLGATPLEMSENDDYQQARVDHRLAVQTDLLPTSAFRTNGGILE